MGTASAHLWMAGCADTASSSTRQMAVPQCRAGRAFDALPTVQELTVITTFAALARPAILIICDLFAKQVGLHNTAEGRGYDQAA